MKLKELCSDELPREKMMAKGAEALSNTELMAILLRTGKNGKNVIELSRELLKASDERLCRLGTMPISRLCRISGIGPGKAITVAAAFELGRRAAEEGLNINDRQISSPALVYRLMIPSMKTLDHEECWVLLLNKANRLVSKEQISRGGQDSTTIDNRIIVRAAIEKKACGVILVHNHPSGNALPSVQDIKQTQALKRALDTCDLSLVDHVIVSAGSYYSFADEELTEEKF